MASTTSTNFTSSSTVNIPATTTANTTINPNRKSMHDVIMENMESENKTTFVHRMIYMFEYNEIREDVELGIMFEQLIEKQNSNYHDERITGILVMYDKVGIHLIEGSDYSLMRHIDLIYRTGNITTWIPDAKIKLLVSVFHIGNRLQKTWSYTYSYPEPPSDALTELMGQEEKNFGELYDKCVEILVTPYGLASLEVKEVSETNLINSTLSEASFGSEGSSENTNEEEESKTSELRVPPTQLVTILINSDFLNDLEIYRNRIKALPIFTLYHECIWPIPTSFVPDYREVVLKDDEIEK